MSHRRLVFITIGIMLSLFLASMEGTVVATAMPTIVSQLGGLTIYSWVFSVYMLASTITGPIYGKLSDLYGRKRIYNISMAIFLAGSVLCGCAQTMEQLVLFRGIQGLGAGGVLPLAFTIVGELFSLEQRARMQGVFSGVWGVSSIIGPLIGGFLVDQISWHWVFYINIFPGLLALIVVWFAWQDEARDQTLQVAVDIRGAVLLASGTICLLLGLDRLGKPAAWSLLAISAVLYAGLVWVERRVADPILPLSLFRDRLFSVAIVQGVMAGWAMFGSLNYVPLFVQAVQGTSATLAGATLTPMSLFWTVAGIFGGRLLLKIGYRTLAITGMIILSVGAFLMSTIGVNSSQPVIMVYVSLMGIGMGLSAPSFLIAVQSTVQKKDLGTATSTIQFSRNIGGTLGVSVLGVYLTTKLVSQLQAAGLNPASISLNSLLDPIAYASATLNSPFRNALAVSISGLYTISFVAAICGLAAVIFAPRGRISQLVEERAVERPS